MLDNDSYRNRYPDYGPVDMSNYVKKDFGKSKDLSDEETNTAFWGMIVSFLMLCVSTAILYKMYPIVTIASFTFWIFAAIVIILAILFVATAVITIFPNTMK